MEWIEIEWTGPEAKSGKVSTLAVEWIEICIQGKIREGFSVSTLAVEWIEIPRLDTELVKGYGLHPRGGVD